MLLKQNTQPTELQSQLCIIWHMTSFINGQSSPPPPFFSPVWLKSCARVSWWLRYYTTPEEQQTRCKLQRVENQIKEKKLRTRLLFFPLLLYLYKPQLSLHLEWNKKCSRTQKLTAFREHKIILSMQFKKKKKCNFFSIKKSERDEEWIDWSWILAHQLCFKHFSCSYPLSPGAKTSKVNEEVVGKWSSGFFVFLLRGVISWLTYKAIPMSTTNSTEHLAGLSRMLVINPAKMLEF